MKVKTFDLKKLAKDRDQLWAEVAYREALGESIRLDTSLWADAAKEQQARLAVNVDPYTETLAEHLANKTGRITSEGVWAILGATDASKRTPAMKSRMGNAMIAIGWKPITVKLGPGKDATRVRGYGKGDDTGRIRVQRSRYSVEVAYDHEGVTDKKDFDELTEADFEA